MAMVFGLSKRSLQGHSIVLNPYLPQSLVESLREDALNILSKSVHQLTLNDVPQSKCVGPLCYNVVLNNVKISSLVFNPKNTRVKFREGYIEMSAEVDLAGSMEIKSSNTVFVRAGAGLSFSSSKALLIMNLVLGHNRVAHMLAPSFTQLQIHVGQLNIECQTSARFPSCFLLYAAQKIGFTKRILQNVLDSHIESEVRRMVPILVENYSKVILFIPSAYPGEASEGFKVVFPSAPEIHPSGISLHVALYNNPFQWENLIQLVETRRHQGGTLEEAEKLVPFAFGKTPYTSIKLSPGSQKYSRRITDYVQTPDMESLLTAFSTQNDFFPEKGLGINPNIPIKAIHSLGDAGEHILESVLQSFTIDEVPQARLGFDITFGHVHFDRAIVDRVVTEITMKDGKFHLRIKGDVPGTMAIIRTNSMLVGSGNIGFQVTDGIIDFEAQVLHNPDQNLLYPKFNSFSLTIGKFDMTCNFGMLCNAILAANRVTPSIVRTILSDHLSKQIVANAQYLIETWSKVNVYVPSLYQPAKFDVFHVEFTRNPELTPEKVTIPMRIMSGVFPTRIVKPVEKIVIVPPLRYMKRPVLQSVEKTRVATTGRTVDKSMVRDKHSISQNQVMIA